MQPRSLMAASAAALLVAVALALGATFASGPASRFAWGPAHGAVALYGFLLPAFGAVAQFGVTRFTHRKPDIQRLRLSAGAYFAGALMLGGARLVSLRVESDWVAVAGAALLAAGGVLYLLGMMPALPRRKDTLVRADDPLTKGDDACFKQVRFSLFMLPPALVLVGLSHVASLFAGSGDWPHRFLVSGLHLLLAGHVLLSTYAIGHLWIPRFSGVPAIAAGAIKGELHSTMGGLLCLLIGFLTDGVWDASRGFLVAGGAFLFLGVFTFMGVLGANIMKNKSKTQRVTPEFVYIPWTFSGVFWLLSGILLGLFLNAVPDELTDKWEALRFTHIHAALFGGAAQLLFGWLLRAFPIDAGRAPPSFGSNRVAFLLVNAGLAVAIGGALGSGFSGPAFAVGAVTASLGVALTFKTLATIGRA